jgi:hypothetical protein
MRIGWFTDVPPLLEFMLKCNVGLSPMFICIHIISVLTNNTNLATYDEKSDVNR